MRCLLRRFLVIFFALLQCVAPLLHAHASTAEHGGLHLPDLPAPTQVQDGLSWELARHDSQQAAVSPEGSLEARHDGLPLDQTGPVSRSAAIDALLDGPVIRAVLLDGSPRLTRYLIPQSCAPPGI